MNRADRRLFLAAFKEEGDILAIVRTARQRGYEIADAYTPYPVHGLDEAMGLRASRLPWVCFVLGAVGGTLALVLQQYLSAVQWPLNVGGKPWNSLPAFIPVAFEITVLCAGLGTVAAFLIRHRLAPGKSVTPVAPRVSDDQFVLVLVQADAGFDVEEAQRMCAAQHAVWVEERLGDIVVRHEPVLRRREVEPEPEPDAELSLSKEAA